MTNLESTSTEKSNSSKRLWVLWVMFFFQFAAIGVYFTFLNVYFREAGLTGTQIGILNMSVGVIGMLAAVMWGNVADRTGQSRLLIAGGAVGGLLVAQVVPYVHTFGAFLALGCLGNLLGSAASTLVDSTTLVLLGDRRENYGRYRLGGSVGYIIATGTVGFVFDRLGLRLMFPAYGIIMAMFAMVALLLPAIPVRREARDPRVLAGMVRSPAWLLFIAVMFLTWVANNASILFLGVSMSAMGANQALIGVAVTIGAVIEVPFMAFSGALLRRFGATRLMLFAMSLMVVRYFLLGIMPAPQWAVAINLLNGLAFPLFWVSSVTYANKMAPPGLAGTAQGLLNSASSLASIASSLATGALFDLLGPTGVFVVMAGVVFVALVLFSVGQVRIRRAAVGQV